MGTGTTVTGRQRVLAALEHQHGDRVPVDYWACGEVTTRLPARYGLDHEEQLPRRLGVDLRYVMGPAFAGEQLRLRAETLGPGGGYIFGTAHNLLPDVPTENIVALFEAYEEYGSHV